MNRYLQAQCEITSYKPIHPEWYDFMTEIDRFDNPETKRIINICVDGLWETAKSTVEKNHKTYELLTELVMFTNWKCWEHYRNAESTHSTSNQSKEMELSKIYSDIFYKLQNRFDEIYYQDEEAETYYYKTTD